MFTLEVLDSILSILSTEPKSKKYFKTIENSLYKNILFRRQLSELIIKKSLEKLISENYVTQIDTIVFNELLKQDLEETIYEITWEGHFFISQGGYLGQNYKNNEEKERIIKLENAQTIISERTIKTQEAQVTLSRILVFLTGIATIYYLFEILKSLCFIHQCL